MRVLIAEDNALLRDGLTRLLTAHGFDVVAAIERGPELVDALLTHRPDVAIVDVRLPPTFTNEGLWAALEARRQVPGLPVLILSQYVRTAVCPGTPGRRRRSGGLPTQGPSRRHRLIP